MKGTLFSADFIKDESGNLKLLEVNTDTGFIDAASSHFDFSGVKTLLEANNLTKVHIVHKDFQDVFVNQLEAYLLANVPSVTNVDRTTVDASAIYPPALDDADDTFILRLAYDETALFDSQYTKNTSNIFKLFIDNNDQGVLAEFAYQSDEWSANLIDSSSLNNPANLPDFTVKDNSTTVFTPLHFYKVGQSDLTPEERTSAFIDDVLAGGVFVQKFYNTTEGTSKVKSIRTFNIIFGSNLDLLQLAAYEVDAVLEVPSSLDVDDTVIANALPKKHYYEFTTNNVKVSDSGILAGETILSASGDLVALSDAQTGQEFSSYFVAGTPDTDNYAVLREWSHDGSELPSGSYETTSTLMAKHEVELRYNVVAKVVAGANTFRISPFLYVLAYNVPQDKFMYRHFSEMNTTDYKLFNRAGELVNIDSIEIEILDGDYTGYVLNMEPVDTYFLGDGVAATVNILFHNCFPEGTQITLPSGDTKLIEEIAQGEEVASYNEETGEVEPAIVGEIKESLVNSIVKITTSGEGRTDLMATPEHPLFVKGKGWVKIGEVEVGDVIIKEGPYNEGTVETKEVIEDTFTVYNLLSVGENHNFFANGYLVHNK